MEMKEVEESIRGLLSKLYSELNTIDKLVQINNFLEIATDADFLDCNLNCLALHL